VLPCVCCRVCVAVCVLPCVCCRECVGATPRSSLSNAPECVTDVSVAACCSVLQVWVLQSACKQCMCVCRRECVCVCVCVTGNMCVCVSQGMCVCTHISGDVWARRNTLGCTGVCCRYVYRGVCVCVILCVYGVATISRLLKIIGLFCKRAL